MNYLVLGLVFGFIFSLLWYMFHKIRVVEKNISNELEYNHELVDLLYAEKAEILSECESMVKSEVGLYRNKLLSVESLLSDCVLSDLSPREREIYNLFLENYTQSDIALRLGVSQPFVSKTLKKIRNKVIIFS